MSVQPDPLLSAGNAQPPPPPEGVTFDLHGAIFISYSPFRGSGGSIFFIHVVQHIQIELGELGGVVGLNEVALEGDDGGGEVAGVVTDEAEGGLWVEGVGGELEHVVAPVAEAVGGEGLPRGRAGRGRVCGRGQCPGGR